MMKNHSASWLVMLDPFLVTNATKTLEAHLDNPNPLQPYLWIRAKKLEAIIKEVVS